MACARSPAPEPKTNPPTTRLSNPQTTHSQTAMTEKSIVIYHNSRCSKSRSVCALVSERKIDAKIVEYLETPPNKAELRALLHKLGMKPGELVRRGERIYQEKVSGARAERAELARLLEALRPGDTLVVWRLDRLGRSLRDAEAVRVIPGGAATGNAPFDTTRTDTAVATRSRTPSDV